MARRGRRVPLTTPEARLHQRVAAQEGRPEAWRSFPRIVRGAINTTTPSIVRGSGFTIATKHDTGDCTITFTTPFAAAPVVIVTANATGDDARTAMLNATTTTTTARLRSIIADGASVDGDIEFIAIEP